MHDFFIKILVSYNFGNILNKCGFNKFLRIIISANQDTLSMNRYKNKIFYNLFVINAKIFETYD